MRVNQFLLEYERELSKRRRPSSANSSRRSLKPSRSVPGSLKVKPKGRSKLPSAVQHSEAKLQPLYPVDAPTFEEQLDEAIRRRKLKIQLEGVVSPEGRVWGEKSTDRSGVKKIDDVYQKTPDKQSATAMREIQLTAQGNVQRLSTIIQLAKDIRVIESGIGSAGGHIARELRGSDLKLRGIGCREYGPRAIVSGRW